MNLARGVFLLVYNMLVPILMVAGLPMFLVKTWKRKGFGTGIRQKFGCFSGQAAPAPGGVYVHAVSVGEAMIAFKWIREWQLRHPGDAVTLALGTSTSHELARTQAPAGVSVIYAPLDFPGLGARVLNRVRPRAVVLVEAELWPNFAFSARRRHIPVIMVNARLSPRSERRYRKLGAVARAFFSFIDAVGAQDAPDIERLAGIGIPRDAITLTGSIKFDQETAPDTPRDEALLAEMQAVTRELRTNRIAGGMAGDRPQRLVMAASTHAGEELLIASAVRAAGCVPVIVPRHVERRAEIRRELEAAGFGVQLRSEGGSGVFPAGGSPCYVIDVTGELRLWTRLVDLVIVGKSLLAEGGQNPAEAVAAHVPVVTGPNMQNFAALMELLGAESGFIATTAEQLGATLQDAISPARHPDGLPALSAMAERAFRALAPHSGATRRSVELVEATIARFS